MSICIPVLSDPTLVLGCLDALTATSGWSETETVVVANGMSQSARQALEERDDIVLVRSGTNLGFGGGNNLAGEIARGDYLFFVNDDSTVASNCIAQLVATAELDPTIGSVGCRILSEDGSLQEAGSVLWADGSTERVGFGLPAGTRRYRYLRDVDFMSANGLMVRREAWNAVGGFDERYYPAYFEDVDLCMAMREHGYRVVYEPRALLHHLESQSTTARYRKFLLKRNRQQFVEKWRSELAGFGERPEHLDDSAIEWSIHRARGSPPRLLLVAEGVPEGSARRLWDAVEALGAVGWAITVVSSVMDVEPDSGADRSTQADRWAATGVDLRTDVDEVLATAGADWDAVVVTASTRWRQPPVIRSDGTEVPVVRFSPEHGDADLRSSLSSIVPVRRDPTTGLRQ